MSYSNPINLTTDSSSSDSVWDEFVLNNPGRAEKEVFEEVSSRKRTHSGSSKGGWNSYFPPMNTTLSNPSAAGPSAIQPRPQNAIIKEDSSNISSYVSPYESTNDDTSSRVLVVPPIAVVIPPEELQAPPSQALLIAPPPEGPSSSSSSPPIRGKVIGLACPQVWRVIEGRRASKVMPEWALPKKP